EAEEFTLGHGADIFAENANRAGIRFEEAVGKFERESLARTGLAEKDEGFARHDAERDIAQDVPFVEANANSVELYSGTFVKFAVGSSHQKILSERKSASLVRKVSAMMMSTEEMTTA